MPPASTAIVLVGKSCMCWEESWNYLTVVPNLFCWEYLLLFRGKVGKILFFPTKITTFNNFTQPFRTNSSIIPTLFSRHNLPVLGFSTLAELFCWEFRIGHVMESNQSSFTSLVFHISLLCSLYLYTYLLNAQRSYASTLPPNFECSTAAKKLLLYIGTPAQASWILCIPTRLTLVSIWISLSLCRVTHSKHLFFVYI